MKKYITLQNVRCTGSIEYIEAEACPKNDFVCEGAIIKAAKSILNNTKYFYTSFTVSRLGKTYEHHIILFFTVHAKESFAALQQKFEVKATQSSNLKGLIKTFVKEKSDIIEKANKLYFIP